MTYFCPSCGHAEKGILSNRRNIFCSVCGTRVFGEGEIPVELGRVPDDWSVLQIGSKGIYKDKPFVITGRYRFQFKNDFRNFWCAQYQDGSMWIDQSLECLRFFTSPWTQLPIDTKKIKANDQIDLSDKLSLTCDFVAIVTKVQAEGEVSSFPIVRHSMRVAEMMGPANTAFIVLDEWGLDYFIWGELYPGLDYPFQNLRVIDGWK